MKGRVRSPVLAKNMSVFECFQVSVSRKCSFILGEGAKLEVFANRMQPECCLFT